MSKSKELEFTPPPLQWAEISKDVFKELYTYDVAVDIIEEVLERGTSILYNRYLKTKMPMHYADFLTDVSRELVTHNVRAYDPGETMENIIFYWSPEDEPVYT